MKLLIEDNKIQSMSYVNFTEVEKIIKQIGELDIIGFSPEYLDTIINEISPDNMGVDFSKPIHRGDSFTTEQAAAVDAQVDNIEAGMQGVRTLNCPHCGTIINY